MATAMAESATMKPQKFSALGEYSMSRYTGMMSRKATTPTRTFATWRSPSPQASNMAASGLFQNSRQALPRFPIFTPWKRRPCVDRAARHPRAAADYGYGARAGATPG